MAIRHARVISTGRVSVPASGREVVQVLTDLAEARSAFYIPNDGPIPANDVSVSWGTHHVEWMDADGSVQRVRKIDYDFDPFAPLH